MREIRFRAYVNNKQNRYMAIQGEPDLETLESFIFHYGSENNLMQFTGLKDKNGIDIYEGDIVIYNRGIGNWTGKRMSTTHEIVFTDEVFAFVMKYGSSYIKLRKHWNYIYEVIGNIHENPELLAVPTAVL